jgi:hypothetical protein
MNDSKRTWNQIASEDKGAVGSALVHIVNAQKYLREHYGNDAVNAWNILEHLKTEVCIAWGLLRDNSPFGQRFTR